MKLILHRSTASSYLGSCIPSHPFSLLKQLSIYKTDRRFKMSTSTEPEWRKMLNQSLSDSMKENKDSITYALSTVENQQAHTRFVVHRGFVNEHRKESLEGLKNSPDLGSSNVLLIASDARHQKAFQIDNNSNVDLAWWFEPTGQQYRITGSGYVYYSPEYTHSEGSKGKSKFPDERLAPSKSSEFDWESERIRIWRKLSPTLRASYTRPTPGKPLSLVEDPKTWLNELPSDLEVKSDEEKANLQVALKYFALIAIEPKSIDWVSLKEVPNRRKFYKLNEQGEWSSIEVAP